MSFNIFQRSLFFLAIAAGSIHIPLHAYAADESSAVTKTTAPILSSSAVATYVDAEGLKFAIVAAGEASSMQYTVIADLSRALVASGKGVQLADVSSAGDLSSFDDQTIVARLKVYPVDRIAIVRIFPGIQGEADTIIVSFLKTDGGVAAGFRLSAGESLTVNSSVATSADSGLNAKAISAVSSEVQTSVETTDDALQIYQRDKLIFQEWIGVRADTGSIVAQWVRPLKGSSQVPISWIRFYQMVGRTDLAAKYKKRKSLKTGLNISGSLVGLGLIGGGTALIIKELAKHSEYKNLTSGIALMGVGGALSLGTILTAAFINPHVVTTEEVMAMADDYNTKLRKKLGLPKEVAKRKLDVGPTLVQGGGGISVRGQF